MSSAGPQDDRTAVVTNIAVNLTTWVIAVGRAMKNGGQADYDAARAAARQIVADLDRLEEPR